VEGEEDASFDQELLISINTVACPRLFSPSVRTGMRKPDRWRISSRTTSRAQSAKPSLSWSGILSVISVRISTSWVGLKLRRLLWRTPRRPPVMAAF